MNIYFFWSEGLPELSFKISSEVFVGAIRLIFAIGCSLISGFIFSFLFLHVLVPLLVRLLCLLFELLVVLSPLISIFSIVKVAMRIFIVSVKIVSAFVWRIWSIEDYNFYLPVVWPIFWLRIWMTGGWTGWRIRGERSWVGCTSKSIIISCLCFIIWQNCVCCCHLFELVLVCIWISVRMIHLHKTYVLLSYLFFRCKLRNP